MYGSESWELLQFFESNLKSRNVQILVRHIKLHCYGWSDLSKASTEATVNFTQQNYSDVKKYAKLLVHT